MTYTPHINRAHECALCGYSGDHVIKYVSDFDSSKEPFNILTCPKCGFSHTHPVPSQTDLDAYYSEEYYGDTSSKFNPVIEWLTRQANRRRANVIDKLTKKHKPGTSRYRVLDIGCGRANLLKLFARYNYECHGVERSGFEHDDSTISAGIIIHHEPLDKLPMNNNYFDLVIIWHVLEHLNDPINAMDRISNLLDDNSILVISVPNYSSFQSRIFKSNWFHLDIPRHLYHFNKSSLLRLLGDKDFTVLKINTCSLEQGIFGFIQSTFNSLGFMGKPNRFYQTLKRQPKDRNLFVFASGLVGSILLLPFAVLEHFFSCLTSSGSVITIIAQKKDKRKT